MKAFKVGDKVSTMFFGIGVITFITETHLIINCKDFDNLRVHKDKARKLSKLELSMK